MRISLLLRREPFGSILERTLSRFWSEQQGREVLVRWHVGRSSREDLIENGQCWLVNIYLNAIFTPDAVPDVFDPIKREFSRSLVWWKRPLQRGYVALASSRHTARWLAQAWLSVTPPIPDARYLMVVAGNHKIRVLDHRTGVAYGILKDGFRPDFMEQELRTRQQAAALGLPVPALVGVSTDETLFSERYISGTPVNRLPRQSDIQAAVTQAARALQELLLATQEEVPLADYLESLQEQIQRLVVDNTLLSQGSKRDILEIADALGAQLRGRSERVVTALTHGDFQPANILANREGVWLIDWEYAGRRQIAYDALVYAFASRFPTGLADRLHEFVIDGWPQGTPNIVREWPQVAFQTSHDRYLHGVLFLLEELVLRLRENNQPLLTQLDGGFQALLTEISRWIELGLHVGGSL